MTELERIRIAVKALISLGVAKNQEEIGKMIGYTNKSSFSQVLNGKVPLPSDFVDKLCKLDNRLVKMWIVNELGNVLRNKEQSKQVYIEHDDNNKIKGIPLLPFDAFAGIGDSTIEGVNFDIIEERYVVPLFDGITIDFMLPVRGSSMYPKYSSGDVVACKLINELLFVQWNKVYVIDSISQGVIMKRLLKSDDSDHIICRSDNKDYGDFDVPMNDIRSIALVVGVIRLE